MSAEAADDGNENSEVTKPKVSGYNWKADLQNCINAVKATISLNRRAITERDGETRIALLAEVANVQSQLLAQLYELRSYEEQ
jgi:hypothetical protein